MKKLITLVLLFVLGSYSVISIDAAVHPIMICSVDDVCYIPPVGGGGGGSTDTTAPIITANTDPVVIDAWSNTFSMPTCSAFDDVDGNVDCVTTGEINTFMPGWYTLTYTARDSRGNTARKFKNVYVKNARVNDDLLPFDYCKSTYGGTLTTAQTEQCAISKRTHTLISQANNITQIGSSLSVKSVIELSLNEYNARAEQPYLKIGENLTANYIGKVYTYQSSRRESFSLNGYYYQFVRGWNIFSDNDDYHKKYEIYGKYQHTVTTPKSINMYALDQQAVYKRKYAEYVSSFTCSMVGSQYQECHHMVNQYFVPVEIVKQHLIDYLVQLALERDPSFDLGEFMSPYGWIALESFYLYLVNKGILSSVSGVLSITPVTIASLMIHFLDVTSNFINTTHGNQIKAMLETVYNYVLNENNQNKYVVFTEANRLSIDNMEAGLFPSQEHKMPRPDSDFDKNSVMYRYTVTPYSKQTLSHIISRQELIDAKVDVVFYDSDALLYADISHVDSINIADLMKDFVLFKTP